MRFLIALLALAAPCFAQSGQFTIPTDSTSHAINLTNLLPSPDAGKTHLQVSVATTFTQKLTVITDYALPFTVDTTWTNISRLSIGSTVLAEQTVPFSVSVPCHGPGTYSDGGTSQTSIGATYSLNLGGPLILESLASQTWVNNGGQQAGSLVLIHRSVASEQVTYTYLP
jgi:hypothetical protein